MPRIRNGPRELATDRELWERQPGESTTAYKYFLAYRGMEGRRSLRGVAKILGKPVSTVTPHSHREQWAKRADAWDDHLQRVRDEQQIKAEREAVDGMVQRHLKIVQTIERVASVELMRYAHQVQADQANPDVTRDPIMAFETLRKAFDFAMGNEAKIRGVPTYGWEPLPDDDTMSNDTGTQIEMFATQAVDAQKALAARAEKTNEKSAIEVGAMTPTQETGEHVVLPADVLKPIDLAVALEDDDD